MFTDRDKAAVRAIVSIFETGRPRGNYAAVAVLDDGAGISYGAHQATDRSNALDAIVRRYVERGGKFAGRLSPYLAQFALNTPQSIARLGRDAALRSVLKKAAEEKLMRQIQDEVFDEKYMQPAIEAAEGSGWIYPLSLAVVYDSFIHGSWSRIRDGVPAGLPEKQWIARYVRERRAWLMSIGRLRKTVYRMDALQYLIDQQCWQLATPFRVRGLTVTDEHLEV